MKLVALDEIMNLRESSALREIAFNQVRIPEHADNSHTPAIGDALELCLEYSVSDDHMEMPVFLPSNHPLRLSGVLRPSFLKKRFEEDKIMNIGESFALRGIAFHQVGIPHHVDNSHSLAVGDVREVSLEFGVSDDHMGVPVSLLSNHPHRLSGAIRASFLTRQLEEPAGSQLSATPLLAFQELIVACLRKQRPAVGCEAA